MQNKTAGLIGLCPEIDTVLPPPITWSRVSLANPRTFYLRCRLSGYVHNSRKSAGKNNEPPYRNIFADFVFRFRLTIRPYYRDICRHYCHPMQVTNAPRFKAGEQGITVCRKEPGKGAIILHESTVFPGMRYYIGFAVGGECPLMHHHDHHQGEPELYPDAPGIHAMIDPDPSL